MYTALQRTPQRSAANHVCLACRRQLFISLQQTRRPLTTSTEARPADAIPVITPLQAKEQRSKSLSHEEKSRRRTAVGHGTNSLKPSSASVEPSDVQSAGNNRSSSEARGGDGGGHVLPSTVERGHNSRRARARRRAQGKKSSQGANAAKAAVQDKEQASARANSKAEQQSTQASGTSVTSEATGRTAKKKVKGFTDRKLRAQCPPSDQEQSAGAQPDNIVVGHREVSSLRVRKLGSRLVVRRLYGKKAPAPTAAQDTQPDTELNAETQSASNASVHPANVASHVEDEVAPYDNANFGGLGIRRVVSSSPVRESGGAREPHDTTKSSFTQDNYNQGFGLSKLQRALSATQAKPSSLIGNLRKRFFLPGKGKVETVSPFEAMEPSPKFADLERAKNERLNESPESPDQQGLEPNLEPAVTLNMPEPVAIDVRTLHVEPLDIEQPPIPKLSFGLDRVLFNPGVVQLQDSYSRVYNFDPYLQKIMPVREFDFNALKQYKTSSEDRTLSNLAKSHDKKYVGSTSSMTSTLAHFHYLLSHHRNINAGMLSRDFNPEHLTFTRINRAPSSIFLRWQDGTYAIDADKEWDTPNVLMMLGKSMEKLLTMPKDDFERYRKSDSREVSAAEREEPEAFQYTTMGDMLMRSQLDAYDPRLPGNGTFDLKTRAVVSIRMDASDYEPMLGYELVTLQGDYESYEREYFDMIRSTLLKYMLQARMGRMDGIFLAYHNIERLFGFQYLPIPEIDRAIHGQIDRCLGDQEFKLSVRMFNDILNAATAKFPKQSLRIMFETEGEANSELVVLRVFAEPMDDTDIETIQTRSKDANAAYEEKMMGIIRESPDDLKAVYKKLSEAESVDQEEDSDGSVDVDFVRSLASKSKQPLFSALVLVESSINDQIVVRPVNLKPSDKWTVNYSIIELDDSRLDEAWSFYAQAKARRKTTFGPAPDVETEEPKQKGNAYMDRLRSFVAKGRKYRTKMDAAEAGKEPVVWTP
ncbi:hypothetical protein AMS68_005057 [Peltaster fructicola]|uniref:Uncharacterized protein n=1 Tax=Peltaster fructicola TaxID=286661 RepID=A0A6H0XYP6_9PEZI|nr:hypothetical protein AMS68_005057 [Peltaster fructicola]